MTIQCTVQYAFLEFKLVWSENCSKNRKIPAKVDSRIYGRWRHRVMDSLSFQCRLNILNGTAKTPAVNLLRQNWTCDKAFGPLFWPDCRLGWTEPSHALTTRSSIYRRESYIWSRRFTAADWRRLSVYLFCGLGTADLPAKLVPERPMLDVATASLVGRIHDVDV